MSVLLYDDGCVSISRFFDSNEKKFFLEITTERSHPVVHKARINLSQAQLTSILPNLQGFAASVFGPEDEKL